MNVAVPVRPSDPPFKIHLASRSQDGDDWPRKWQGGWRDRHGCMEKLRDHLHRVDANGKLAQRFIIEAEKRTPNAIEPMAVTHGMGWEAMDPFRKHVLIDVFMERRAEDKEAGRPPVTLEFYVGAIGNGMPGLIRNHTADDVLSYDNDKDRETFKRNYEPWIEAEILSGIIWDAGFKVDNTGPHSGEDRQPKVKDLIGDLQSAYGLHGMTEAVQWASRMGRGANAIYTWSAWSLPCLFIGRFMRQRDPNELLVWPWATDHSLKRQEVWWMNAMHTVAGGDRGWLTVNEGYDVLARGFGIGSWTEGGPITGPKCDLLVNLPSLPSVGRPTPQRQPLVPPKTVTEKPAGA